MTLGPVIVMGAGVVVMLCVEEVALCMHVCVIFKNYNLQFLVHHLLILIME